MLVKNMFKLFIKKNEYLLFQTNSPTPSNVSTKSRSGKPDWKRLQDPNKRKNPLKIAQILVVYYLHF